MRILVIEDDPKIATSLARTLSAESYAVDFVRDSVAGEELARVNDYHLIILDISPGRTDGKHARICAATKYERRSSCSPLSPTSRTRLGDWIRGPTTTSPSHSMPESVTLYVIGR